MPTEITVVNLLAGLLATLVAAAPVAAQQTRMTELTRLSRQPPQSCCLKL